MTFKRKEGQAIIEGTLVKSLRLTLGTHRALFFKNLPAITNSLSLKKITRKMEFSCQPLNPATLNTSSESNMVKKIT